MSFLATAKKIINLLDWVTGRYDNVKLWIKKKYKIHRARSIRADVDDKRVSRVRKRIKKILKRRQNKSDGA